MGLLKCSIFNMRVVLTFQLLPSLNFSEGEQYLMQNKSLRAAWEAVFSVCPFRIPKDEPFGQSLFLCL